MIKLRHVFLTLLFLVIVPFTPQIPEHIAAHAPKSGRVVDADTGKGKAGVSVISNARYLSDGLLFGPSANSLLYAETVETDEDGYFYIPSTWSSMKFGVPGSNSRIRWIVTAFEPGYAIVGDEISWAAGYLRDGRSAQAAPSTSRFPKFANPLTMRLETIKIKRIYLNLKDSAWYYSTIASFSHEPEGFPKYSALREKGNAYFREKACASERDLYADSSTMLGIYGFLRSTYATSRFTGSATRPMLGTYVEGYVRDAIKLGDMCDFLRTDG